MKNMKCISDEQIQNFIDNQYSSNKNQLIKMHLAECISCKNRVKKQKLLVETLNKNLKINEDIHVPEFKKPEQKANSLTKHNTFIWLKVSAVLIPLFFIWKLNLINNSLLMDDTNKNITCIVFDETFCENQSTYTVQITDVDYNENTNIK